MNDPFVLQGFTDHSYIGVFQYDSVSADKICRGVVFEKFEDVVAMTALNRPGTSRSVKGARSPVDPIPDETPGGPAGFGKGRG